MEYLILGLLILSPMSGYELQRFIRQNLSLICSHSAGSIQAALGKLMKAGRVSITESAQGRRRKKIFSITEGGRKAFSDWVAQPMQAEKVKNMELARMFFLGLAQPQERIAAIRSYIQQMTEMEAVLTTLRERFRQAQKAPLPSGQDWETIFHFQEHTIAFGIAAAQFERDWYSRLLADMEETT